MTHAMAKTINTIFSMLLIVPDPDEVVNALKTKLIK